MLMDNWHKISFMVIFVLISLLLLNVKPVITPIYVSLPTKKTLIDPTMNGIYVPPAQDSHPKCCPSAGRLSVPNTWNNLPPDNNIPGLLPGPRMGELNSGLGLENNPDLSLSTPIKAPLVNDTFPSACNSEGSYMNKVKGDILKSCLLKANENAMVTTLPASLYYKYRFQQCNPYNGSYCQCTNNYVPLPPVGLCQPNGWNEDVCPYQYRVKPSAMYLDTQKCLAKQF
jgi:hypothetical protein